MKKFMRVALLVPLVSVFAALSLSAMAQQPPHKPPPQKGAPPPHPGGPGPQVRPGPQPHPGPQLRPGPQAHQGPGPGPGPGPGRPGPGFAGRPGHPGGFEPHHHFTADEMGRWRGGHWRPYECRWGRCGYWWWADGYWYFYDHAMDGPPDAVSDYAYDEQGNLIAVGPPPPDYPPPPPPGYYPPPPPVVCVGPLCIR